MGRTKKVIKEKKLDWWVDDRLFNYEPSNFYMCDMYSDNNKLIEDNEYHDQIGLDEVYFREKNFERLYAKLTTDYKFPICDVTINEKNSNLFDITTFFLTNKHPVHYSESYYFLRYDYTFDPIRLGRIRVFLLRYPIIMQGLNIRLVKNAFEYYKVMWDEYDFRFSEWQNDIRRNEELIKDALQIINNKKNMRALVRIDYRKCRNAIWNPSAHFLDFNYSKDPLEFIDNLYINKKYERLLIEEKKVEYQQIDYQKILKNFF